MSERHDILDPKGKRIPLLDRQGNLSAEAMALYVSDSLSTADRAAVDAIAAHDGMTREALDGLLTVAVDHRAAFTSLNAEIAGRTGIATVVHTRQREIPWMRIAAGVALLLGISGITYLASQWLGNREQMAVNETPPLTEAEQPTSLETPAETETTASEEAMTEETVDGNIMEPVKPAPPKAEEKQTEEKKVEEKKADQKKEKAMETSPVADALKADNAPKDSATAKKQEEAPALADNEAKDSDTDSEPAMPASLDGVTTSRQAAKRELQATAQAEAEDISAKESETKAMPFDRADTPPRFPGGDLEMLRFISRNRNYPEPLRNEGVSGAVYVSFTIGQDGRVGNVRVAQGIHATLDGDAMRVIRAMPRWTPAEHGGKKVTTTRTVIVRYE